MSLHRAINFMEFGDSNRTADELRKSLAWYERHPSFLKDPRTQQRVSNLKQQLSKLETISSHER